MIGPSPRHLRAFAFKRLRIRRYVESPGDGRTRPVIAARHLLWAMVICTILRDSSAHAIEFFVAKARRALGVGTAFGDDALGYFTERLSPEPTRRALVALARRAKRNKAFQDDRLIGLALDGSGAGRSKDKKCVLCHPRRDKEKNLVDHIHFFVALCVVGTDLVLPVDIEPYQAGDSEYAAGIRLVQRAVAALGKRFADYLAVDAKFATASFLHAADAAGIPVVARLKDNLPELFAQAQARFAAVPPTQTFQDGKDRVEVWDADDFDPWESLRWKTVRVIRYRQYKPDGTTVVEAYWLTNLETKVGSRALYGIAKSRWDIENSVFNDGKNRYDLEHIAHHHERSLLIGWLLTCLAIAIERLYRLRYLHRGVHAVRSAIELVRSLRLSLGRPVRADTS